MRILQFGMTSNHGGVESFIMNYARSLKKYGIYFDYVDLQGVGLACKEEILEYGGKIYTLKKDHRTHPFLAAKQIREIVAAGGYRCAHVNLLSAASPVATIACLRGGAKVILHAHNTCTVGLHRKVLHAINSRLMRYLPVTRVACSIESGKWMFVDKKYSVIPNAIETDRYCFDSQVRRQLRQELGVEDDTMVVGFVGRLSVQKNPLYLVKILQSVKAKYTAGVKLLIVGDGDLRQELIQSAREYDLCDDIVLLGMREDVARWYSAMDVLVLPSLFEAFPVVGVEAQAAGLPCFFSDRITDDLKITSLAHMCALEESAENWASEICASRISTDERYLYNREMKKSRYSLDKSSEMLRDVYTSTQK